VRCPSRPATKRVCSCKPFFSSKALLQVETLRFPALFPHHPGLVARRPSLVPLPTLVPGVLPQTRFCKGRRSASQESPRALLSCRTHMQKVVALLSGAPLERLRMPELLPLLTVTGRNPLWFSAKPGFLPAGFRSLCFGACRGFKCADQWSEW